MYRLIQQSISFCMLLALFLFGNMAFVHAEPSGMHDILVTISHMHGDISESHTVPSTPQKEPPHCSDTQISSDVIIGWNTLRYNCTVQSGLAPVYFTEFRDSGMIETARYAHTYPWSANESFSHFLVGEQILSI